jgi:hypothetical protein
LEEAIAIRQETEAKLAHAEKKIFELEQLSGSDKVSRYCFHHQFLQNKLEKCLLSRLWMCTALGQNVRVIMNIMNRMLYFLMLFTYSSPNFYD